MTRASALRRRWPLLLGTIAYVELLYLIADWHPLTAAHALPLTAADRLVPFLPWTGWIYVLVYALPLLVCLVARADEDLMGLAVAFAGMDTLCTLVFLAYPTAYPRPPLAQPAAAGAALALVRLVDTPLNCFPSQHVANAVLSALVVRRYDRRAGAAALALAALISLSTLTTKQHYTWDVLAGALAGAGAYALWARRGEPSTARAAELAPESL